MFTARVREVVAAAQPKETITVIVTMKDRYDSRAIDRIKGPKERGAYIDKFYSDIKAPVIKILRRVHGLRIVDTLPGTPQIILSAKKPVWQKLISSDTRLNADNIEVSANDTEVTL